MACISSNRVVCARVVQEKFYQLFVNNKKSTATPILNQRHCNYSTLIGGGGHQRSQQKIAASCSMLFTNNRSNQHNNKQNDSQQFHNGYKFLIRNLSSGGNKQVRSIIFDKTIYININTV